jgi:hypothetical protein
MGGEWERDAKRQRAGEGNRDRERHNETKEGGGEK